MGWLLLLIVLVLMLFGFTLVEGVIAVVAFVLTLALGVRFIEYDGPRERRRLLNAVGIGIVLVPLAGWWVWRGWTDAREERAPVAAIRGLTVTALLTPDRFPEIRDLDPGTFDLAPNGEVALRSGDRILLVEARRAQPEALLLAEQPGLEAFAFAAEGALLTLADGVLGVYDPDASTATSATLRPMGRAGEHPPARVPLAAIQIRGVPTGGYPRGGPVVVGGGGGPVVVGGGGGVGGGSADFSWRHVLWGRGKGAALIARPFARHSLAVDELAAPRGSPPWSGPGPYRVYAAEERPDSGEVHPALVLPSRGMRLAATGRPGELLLFGGEHPGASGDIHLVRSDASARWLVRSPRPVLLAAAANGQLYFVLQQSAGSGTGAFVILHASTDSAGPTHLVFRNAQAADGSYRPGAVLSLAVSRSGRQVFFSTDDGIYVVSGAVVVKLVDGFGGLLRMRGDTLYTFNARRHALLAIVGAAGG
jgi:hypothetical protein